MRAVLVALPSALVLLAPSLSAAQPLPSFQDLALRVNVNDQIRIEDLTREDIAIRTDAGTQQPRGFVTFGISSDVSALGFAYRKHFANNFGMQIGGIAWGSHAMTVGSFRLPAARPNRMETIIIVLSSVARAQPGTQSSAQTHAGHSAWRDTLIGASIGTGIGMALGGVVDRKATCLDASGMSVSGCGGHGGMKLFAGSGVVYGALVGFLVHRYHRP